MKVRGHFTFYKAFLFASWLIVNMADKCCNTFFKCRPFGFIAKNSKEKLGMDRSSKRDNRVSDGISVCAMACYQNFISAGN